MIWWILAAVGFVMVLSRDARAAILRAYSVSATAVSMGLDNMPTDADTISRLLWTAQQEPIVSDLLREHSPNAHMTSAYRSAELNTAIGGSPTSRHMLGLGLDFGGVPDNVGAVRYLRDNALRMPANVRTVIAELDHVHVDFFDPLWTLDSSARAPQWLREQSSGSPRFVEL